VLKPVAGAERPCDAGARPRQHDRESLARAFERYVTETPVPVIAEFASQHGVPRFLLYDWPEFSTLLKLCIDKKESALERGMLSGQLNTAGCIFSLKQLGWSDRVEQTNKDAKEKVDVVAHLEQLANNLEPLMRRRQAAIDAQAQGSSGASDGGLTSINAAQGKH